ncbi:hypothetical protein F4819DRAFT_479059 [Hypoxylon fuscum]|nr:hypothetical protein F4819DRAFT_479059 [Hypoxylon fuscum]
MGMSETSSEPLSEMLRSALWSTSSWARACIRNPRQIRRALLLVAWAMGGQTSSTTAKRARASSREGMRECPCVTNPCTRVACFSAVWPDSGRTISLTRSAASVVASLSATRARADGRVRRIWSCPRSTKYARFWAFSSKERPPARTLVVTWSARRSNSHCCAAYRRAMSRWAVARSGDSVLHLSLSSASTLAHASFSSA